MDAKKILIIDDDAAAVKSTRAVLEQEGYNVYSINTAQGAVERVTQIAPDLIILDLVLPGESGFQIAKEIRSSVTYRDIPIIMVSLKKEAVDKRLAALSGAFAYLEKPVDYESLLFHVKDILTRRETS